MRRASLLVVCAACASPAEHPDAAADGMADCDPHTLPLHVLSLALPTGEPAPAKLYVQVVRDGARGLFLVDTGSATTFLQLPLGRPPSANAGVVRIGCDDVSVRGYPETDLGTVDGLAVIGTFGLDRFLTGPVLVDVEQARL